MKVLICKRSFPFWSNLIQLRAKLVANEIIIYIGRLNAEGEAFLVLYFVEKILFSHLGASQKFALR